MSKRKTCGTENATGTPLSDPGAPTQPSLAIVPRAWLFALAALVIVPWLVVAAVYAWRSIDLGTAETAIAAQPPNSGGSSGPRPWGQLDVTPIVISPPLEFLSSDWGPIEPPRWYFPNVSQPQLEQLLSDAGLDRRQVAGLISASRPELRIKGLVVSPDRDLVRSLAPDVRARLYRQLSTSPLNSRQKLAYRHYAKSVYAWLGPSPIAPQTLRIVEPLVYRIGDFLYFADIDIVLGEITDPTERKRLAKGLLRDATVLVRLSTSKGSRINEIAEYWGRGGRTTDIRPLLESIAANSPGESVDISHLLPSLARKLLYRYPRITLGDFDKAGLPDCLWTALNFFSIEPDDRFLKPAIAIEHLKREYYIVQGELQLGDIMAFSDSVGNYFHVAVYIADNLVFSKNGNSQFAPWVIVPIERLKGYYVDYANDWNVTSFRRKDL